MKLGIVGLPNVGKSTLFNAITKAGAEIANYPFCTIDPNVGLVNVPDSRVDYLAKMHNSKKVVPAAIEFYDIAGLVKGASKGEGLGNKFLSNIRETDAIVEVLRCFNDPNVTHVDGKIDPLRDIEISELESDEEKKEFLEMIGLEESGCDQVIRDSYKTLNLISFLTTGEDETRAWTITNGTKAVDAAGKIHTDIQRGFIKAEIVSFETLKEYGNMTKVKEHGQLRMEGKDYVMKDGDITNFKFNV